MLKSVGNLFKRTGLAILDETDRRAFVERWLRERLTTRGIYCERVRGGQVNVRVADALIGQEVRLLQYDLGLAMQAEADSILKELIITQS